jgi:hypothetical protein
MAGDDSDDVYNEDNSLKERCTFKVKYWLSHSIIVPHAQVIRPNMCGNYVTDKSEKMTYVVRLTSRTSGNLWKILDVRVAE